MNQNLYQKWRVQYTESANAAKNHMNQEIKPVGNIILYLPQNFENTEI